MRMSNFALKPIKLTLFEATDGDLAAAPKTPILKSQRTPKDFRNPTIKTDRRLSRDSSYVAEFVNTPIRLEDVAIELSEEEAAMLDGLRPFMEPTTALRCATSCSRGGSRHSLAPRRAERRRSATGRREARANAVLYCAAGPCRFQINPSLQVIVTPSADSRPVLRKQATPSAPMGFP
jgi:hypothetical protein